MPAKIFHIPKRPSAVQIRRVSVRYRKASLAARALSCAVLALGGCGAGQSMLETAPLVFSGPPTETVASDAGLLAIGLRWSPPSPGVGYDAGELTITDATGAPVTGLTLAIVPWMPAHGHGASVAPTVSETDEPGVYVAAPLDFYMSGTWQLRTTITGSSDAGPTDDTAQPSVDIP
jgi:hypothetical protein